MRGKTWLLGMGLVLAACGGAVQGTQAPATSPTSPSTATTTTTTTATATATATTTLPSTPSLAPSPVEMKAPVPTGLVADLQALGLDAKNLPPIEKLEPKTLRSVMKLLARSLGAKCGDCHQEGDFAAPTRRKKIAARMWNDFAGKLVMSGGGPLFCDSCHQGRVVQLDRRDKKALSKWMDDNFVAKLARKDGKSHECETCHVDMDMTFLATWGR
jgi:cytochrome c7-like protein